MAKAPQPLPAKGDANAADLYFLVGQALSWWEGAEDETLALFRVLCDPVEPVAVQAYIRAPRAVRSSMLRLALETYSYLITMEESQKLDGAMRALDKLAVTRNQIAHGHVSQQNHVVDGFETASGNYLMPNLNEGDYFERTFRFVHTSATVLEFITAVRAARSDIMDVRYAMLTRKLARERFGMDDQAFFNLARKIARLEVPGRQALDKMRELIAIIDGVAAPSA